MTKELLALITGSKRAFIATLTLDFHIGIVFIFTWKDKKQKSKVKNKRSEFIGRFHTNLWI